MAERYLVTGGAGFIGSNIVKELLGRGSYVKVLDDFSTGRRENLEEFRGKGGFELVEGDLRNWATVQNAVKGMDFVLHQGALPSVSRSIIDPTTTNNVNILGTLNVLEAAKEFHVRRVVYASSSSVYGNIEVLPKVEEMPVQPLSPYALSKYTAERYCQIYYNIYGLETVALRYFNVFGPNQDPTSEYSAVIPKFIRAMKQDEQPVIYGDGTQSRDFTYVLNNVEAVMLACKTDGIGGEVFNVACGQRYTLLDLVERLGIILGKRIEPIFRENRPGDVKHSCADIQKARQRLGFEPGISFDEGLRLTVEKFSPSAAHR